MAALTGLILAGGRSVRMGADKARLLYEGQALVLRVAERIAPACTRVLVASGDGHRLDDLGVTQVSDAVADAGPLGGLLAGLEAAEDPLVAVVAVDMPAADPEVLLALAGAWSKGSGAVVPVVDGRAQPLHAVWARASAPAVRALLDAGGAAVRRTDAPSAGRADAPSVQRALELVEAALVGPEVWGAADPAGAFARNLNRPEDLPAPG